MGSKENIMSTYRTLPEGEYEQPAIVPVRMDWTMTNGAVLLFVIINILFGFFTPILFAYFSR